MTMNLIFLESMIAERNRGLLEADGRRWPEVRHARTVRSGRGMRPARGPAADLAGTQLVPDRAVARR